MVESFRGYDGSSFSSPMNNYFFPIPRLSVTQFQACSCYLNGRKREKILENLGDSAQLSIRLSNKALW